MECEDPVAEPIYICTVCGKQLKASECAAHTKSCKQPKGMSGNQFFMIEPDEPETKPVEEKPVEEKPVEEAPAAEGEKKKKKRKHHRTEEEEEKAPEPEPQPQPVVEEPSSGILSLLSSHSPRAHFHLPNLWKELYSN